jgi:hypothetical protein
VAAHLDQQDADGDQRDAGGHGAGQRLLEDDPGQERGQGDTGGRPLAAQMPYATLTDIPARRSRDMKPKDSAYPSTTRTSQAG